MRSRLAQAVLAVVLALVIGWPVAATVREAWLAPPVTQTGEGGLPRPLVLAIETARVVGVTEVIALPIGVVVALLLFRTNIWGRRVMLGLLALVAFVPMPL